MLTLRRAMVVLGWVAAGVGAGGSLVAAVDGQPGRPEAWLLAVFGVLGALAGAWLGLAERRDVRPFTDLERRDTWLGWAIGTGLVAVLLSLLLPWPWGVVVAPLIAVAVGVTLVRLVRITRPSPPAAVDDVHAAASHPRAPEARTSGGGSPGDPPDSAGAPMPRP